jgi:hypothetical protein
MGAPNWEPVKLTLSNMVGALSLARAVGDGPLSAEILKRVRTQIKSRQKQVTDEK